MSRRVLSPDTIIPRLAVGLVIRRWSAQVGATAEDPDEKQKTGDRTDDDAGDGAAA